MNVLIIEDEPHAAKRLAKLLQETDHYINIIGVCESITSSVKWFNSNSLPDLVMMDIQLSDGLSFDIFKHVEITCPIIFTTAFDEYAIQAFKVNSIDYLLKPINVDDLKASLEKFNKLKEVYSSNREVFDLSGLIKSLSQNTLVYKTRFLIKSGQSFIKVSVDECAYFYIDNKLSYLVTFKGKKAFTDLSMEDLEKQLNPHVFFRANRQYIINIEAIENIHNYFSGKLKLKLKLETPSEIIISRLKANQFKEWMQK